MELRTISLGTRRRASSAFSDPLYDNCRSPSESGDPGLTRAPPSPGAAVTAAVPTLGGRGDGSVPGGPGSDAWGAGSEGRPEPAGGRDAVSCSNTHKSILSLYDNLADDNLTQDNLTQDNLPEDNLDAEGSELGSQGELFERKDWMDFTDRTGDGLTSFCGNQADSGRGTKRESKRTRSEPDPFLFSAVPHPFSSAPLQTEPLIRDFEGDVSLHGTSDLHNTTSLNPSPIPTLDPSSFPASVSPPSSQPVVHVAQPSSPMAVLLSNIGQQITRQRQEYEIQIRRLEQRNEALEAEVLGLRANLEQQRRWYRAVEMRLCEVEQARVAADRRNAELQSQMEQFFDAFGELTNEAKKTERIVQGF